MREKDKAWIATPGVITTDETPDHWPAVFAARAVIGFVEKFDGVQITIRNNLNLPEVGWVRLRGWSQAEFLALWAIALAQERALYKTYQQDAPNGICLDFACP